MYICHARLYHVCIYVHMSCRWMHSFGTTGTSEPRVIYPCGFKICIPTIWACYATNYRQGESQTFSRYIYCLQGTLHPDRPCEIRAQMLSLLVPVPSHAYFPSVCVDLEQNKTPSSIHPLEGVVVDENIIRSVAPFLLSADIVASWRGIGLGGRAEKATKHIPCHKIEQSRPVEETRKRKGRGGVRGRKRRGGVLVSEYSKWPLT